MIPYVTVPSLPQVTLALLIASSIQAATLDPLTVLAAPGTGLRIIAPAQAAKPWTVAGEHGALFGRQNGRFEVWQWPVKILSNFSIRAELADYPVPIDVNALAAEIKVLPGETVITYSHSAFTVRQRMFAPRGVSTPPMGASVVFEVESARPIELTFSFTPEMLRMWPASNFGRPNGEWITQGESGLYVVHTDDPHMSAVVAMPRTRPGILVPYQEHPQTYPLELKLQFDPKRDRGLAFPLLMAVTKGESPFDQAAAMEAAVPGVYKQTQDYYAHFLATHLSVETPDRRIDEALQWAEVAIDQAQVKYKDEIGMVAGYYESADSARPGYAWFFGRDTMWTTYAINSYGDFALTRRALDFLIRRQRADGKIMHEFSQSADALDWKETPYFYAAADSAPLFVMTMWDYVRTSGDVSYLKKNWEAVRKAYGFTRAHEGNDGIYNNSQGTGWVESWPQGMPKEEIYLAALDQQSSDAMAGMAGLLNEKSAGTEANKKAGEIRSKLESEFYNSPKQFYAFSRNDNGSLDETASIYPAVAWWDGTLGLEHAGPMLSRWASNEFSSDWGTRDISDRTPFYDPISYHQGTIWPLFTGWASLAEYRSGRELSGYAHLMQNLGLTWAQDLGSVTELLSGDFYQPLGRSSSHQLWSSAMVISPLMRGLFGLDWDAVNRSLRVAPHLPADWEHARLRNVPIGTSTVDIDFDRSGSKLSVRAKGHGSEPFCIVNQTAPVTMCRSNSNAAHTVTMPLRAVELAIPADLPEPGASTSQLKVLDEQYGARQAVFNFEAQGHATYDLPVRINHAHVTVQGAELFNGKLRVQFPEGSGYQGKTVTFVW